MTDRKLHVVFGAGQIGTPLARNLLAAGHAVRMVRRSGGGPEGVELRHGDAGDPAFATVATQGAAAIYHCMNPAYSARAWAAELPRFMSALITAAARNHVRLVVLDNVYMLGRPGGRALNEDTPVAPCSRKGEIRARVSADLAAAEKRGDVRAVVGRASDFYGPGGVGTYFGDAFWPKALKSGVAETLMNLETPHTYHYTLDVAAALATLGQAADDVTGRWWMLPAAPAETSRAMIERLSAALGRELRIRPMPRTLNALLKLFVPILGEIAEMSYQWEEPFVMDDRRFRERFGSTMRVTSLAEGAPATVEWAKQHYAARSR